MPPKKKQPKSAYFYFMQDLQKEWDAEGKKKPSMDEMRIIAGPKWDAMSAEEKEVYNEKARLAKGRGQAPSLEGKYTSDGIPILQLQAEMEELEQEKMQMKRDIQLLVQSMGSVGEIADADFIIMGFNILCATDNPTTFIPNELGMVKHSLNEGVQEKFHKFIHPGPIPVGYTSDAKLFSEKTHQIPIHASDLEEFDENYKDIYNEIKRFTGVNQGETAFVFCLPNDLEQNAGCLDWLKQKAWTRERQQLYFADITWLLMELAAAVDQPFPAESLAEDVLNQHSFDYSLNTRCTFHEELDNAHCALAYSQRLSFIMSDCLCPKYDITVTDKHLPLRLDRNVHIETWQPKAPIRPVINKVNVTLKPVREHQPVHLKYKERSIFGDYDDARRVPSAMAAESLPPRSELSEQLDIQDTEQFPSLGQGLGQMYLHSTRHSEPRAEARASNNVWANMGRGRAMNPPPGFSGTVTGQTAQEGVGIGRGVRRNPINKSIP